MYSELYCGNEREESLQLMREGIEYAVRADMYVLVDWHILNDKDPNENIEQAEEFFSLIAEEYGNVPNILYDRIPALPQNLNRDLGIIAHLWVNIAHRLARTKL